MKERIQKGAIGTAQALVNLCKSMKDCSECPFAYWDDSYDKGIAHCTIGSPADWDIERASIKPEDTEQKEKPKKIVPYDLSLEEDRNALMGKVIRWTRNRDEREGEDDRADIFMINTFARDIQDVEDESQDFWCTFNIATGFLDGEELLKEYVFADTGKPVGKEVKE